MLQNKNWKISFVYETEFGLVVDISNGIHVTEVQNLFLLLGGSIKLAKVVSNFVNEQKDKKITFGVSYYGKKFCYKDLISQVKNLKELLCNQGMKVRFVLPTEGMQLTSVVIKKQKVNEFIIFDTESKRYLAETIDVFDFEDWNRRDYDRPEIDPHKGMLPPRVARMMMNIGLKNTQGKQQTILDPFCGVGTVLAEGIMLECLMIGSDIDTSQVVKAQKNLEWLSTIYEKIHSSSLFRVFCGDARNLSSLLGNVKIDAIVTEPSLGPNDGVVTEKDIKALENLYNQCLFSWKEFLPRAATIVIVLPSFSFRVGQNKSGYDDSLVKNVIDNALRIGYILKEGPIPYSRTHAVVRRNICVFES